MEFQEFWGQPAQLYENRQNSTHVCHAPFGLEHTMSKKGCDLAFHACEFGPLGRLRRALTAYEPQDTVDQTTYAM